MKDVGMYVPCISSIYIRSRSKYEDCRQGRGSGFESGSSRHHAVRKPLIPTVLWLLYDFLSVKINVNVPSKSNKKKNLGKNNFLLASWRSLTQRAWSGSGAVSVSQRYGTEDQDPDSYQNVTDPEHCPRHTSPQIPSADIIYWQFLYHSKRITSALDS